MKKRTDDDVLMIVGVEMRVVLGNSSVLLVAGKAAAESKRDEISVRARAHNLSPFLSPSGLTRTA